MKTLNYIFNWLVSSGTLIAVGIFAWSYVKPWLDNKSEHAATEQSKAVWMLLEKVAATAVEALVSQPMTGQDKFNEATKNVETFMKNQGFVVTKELAESAVQSAYEKSLLTPTVINKEEK
ncbi:MULTISPECIES: phage holin, LLH family [Lactobacillaceae]|uniref:phage holin, LLH family n=1 Tax=Lactobacillaceae TaxID=33958 RepID=UPI001C5B9210|nr:MULTISPECIES: phage holin, LLH family [Lactobacillaceae]MBW3349831.1 phage holin family protein [Limosilactobacillus reuteri]MCC4348371.1 phage holin family protein [Limosilactobacillus reuteri]MCC4375289.1 phage holin family protein [Limosilactobacillus reuteri]MCC4385242.1 phage holin family protein [Limosilactobacillus reuteri]MCC4502053.1 phage holin family protein [Limosilactobacillus reuteri]